MNDIDKLDGMIKLKGKCGYKFIGGCRELKKYKQALEEIRGIAKNACDSSVCHYNCKQCSDGKIIEKINEVLK